MVDNVCLLHRITANYVTPPVIPPDRSSVLLFSLFRQIWTVGQDNI